MWLLPLSVCSVNARCFSNCIRKRPKAIFNDNPWLWCWNSPNSPLWTYFHPSSLSPLTPHRSPKWYTRIMIRSLSVYLWTDWPGWHKSCRWLSTGNSVLCAVWIFINMNIRPSLHTHSMTRLDIFISPDTGNIEKNIWTSFWRSTIYIDLETVQN